ncbi:hypothetical protein ACGFZU_35110 [Streptomyces tendae]|uniref:hypothetical protein n=1 Tax=Streptomyces tendae TaxID=1932 RepID=UPI00371EDD3F
MSSLTIPTTATAAEIATAALAEWGITAHADDEPLIGGARNSWLIINSDQRTTEMDMSRPYVALYVYTDGDEVWVHQPITSPFDSWHVVVGDGTGKESLDFTTRTPGITEAAAFIADWLTAPRT